MSFSFLDSKKNLIQKGKREKLPVDVLPPPEQKAERSEQVVVLDVEIPNTKSSDAEAQTPPTPEALRSTQGLCQRSVTAG